MKQQLMSYHATIIILEGIESGNIYINIQKYNQSIVMSLFRRFLFPVTCTTSVSSLFSTELHLDVPRGLFG